MDVRLLHGFRVSENGAEVELGGRKPRTLLAILAAHASSFVGVDRLIEAVWGEDASPGAKRSLQTYISSLRSAIDPKRQGRLEGSDDGYRLAPQDGDHIDLHEFRSLVKSGELDDAIRLWDDPLGDLAYDEWAQPFIREWTGEFLGAVELWADTRLAEGDPDTIVADLERLVAEHPHHERLTAKLMTALYQTGRQSEALDRYRLLASHLGEDMGIEPSPELQNLEERILLHDPSLGVRKPTPTNVDSADVELVGRTAELATLEQLITSNRLLTITGARGTGKTTIARVLAGRVFDQFPDGVWWLSLAPFGTADVVPYELLGAMRQTAPAAADPLDTLIGHLRTRRSLIVFDNCEHLVEPMTATIGAILRGCPGVTVVATSREQLVMAGEVSWRLPTLSIPDRDATDAESVSTSESGFLFAVRAAQADSGFVVTDDNAARVGSICRRLDGLPLAIELAAAQVSSMGLGELEGRLDDRFHALGAAPADDGHHRTPWETVAWSYDLLTPDQQELYRRLGVFRGGFDVAGAEALSPLSDTVEALDALVVRSLVVVDTSRVVPRYSMLETIREHASIELERRGELDSARRRHLGWASDLVREGSRHLEGPDFQAWTKRYRLEMDNFRAGLEYATEHDPVTGSRLTAGLSRFWWGHATDGDPATLDDATSFLMEGRAWALRMLDAAGPELPAKDRARLLISLGGLLEIRLGRFEEAIAHLDLAIRALDDLDESRLVAWAEFYRGMASWGLTPPEETFAALDRAAQLSEATGDLLALLSSVHMRGWVHAAEGRYEDARSDIEMTLAWAQKSGNPATIAHAEDGVVCLAILAGWDTSDAPTQIRKVIQRFRRIPNYACIAHGLHTGAAWLASQGRLEDAAIAMGIVEGIRDRLSMVIPPYEDRTFIVDGAGLELLDQQRRAELVTEGRKMAPDEGIDWIVTAVSG